MEKQPKGADGPARVVLEGVPRVHFYDGGKRAPEGVPFASCLAACLEFMGQEQGYREITEHDSIWLLNNAYVSIMGASGAAFRLTWNSKKWDPANTSTNVMASDALEPIRRAFGAVGYAHEAFGNAHNKFVGHEGVDFFNRYEDHEYCVGRVVESIRDIGRPAIGFGVIGPPECCVITGYDDHGEVLIGWNLFQGFPDFNEGVEFEPSGYFRKRDWFDDTQGFILIGEKQERPPLAEIYRKALQWALEVVRRPEVHDYRGGLAAYEAWAEALLRDEDFPTGDMSALRERHMVHNDGVGSLAEGRWYAAHFLKQVAEAEPMMAEDLSAAAACYDAEHDLMWKVWHVMGGREWSDELVKRLAQPAVRREIAPLILEAREKDAEAAEHIERALASPATKQRHA